MQLFKLWTCFGSLWGSKACKMKPDTRFILPAFHRANRNIDNHKDSFFYWLVQIDFVSCRVIKFTRRKSPTIGLIEVEHIISFNYTSKMSFLQCSSYFEHNFSSPRSPSSSPQAMNVVFLIFIIELPIGCLMFIPWNIQSTITYLLERKTSSFLFFVLCHTHNKLLDRMDFY